MFADVQPPGVILRMVFIPPDGTEEVEELIATTTAKKGSSRSKDDAF